MIIIKSNMPPFNSTALDQDDKTALAHFKSKEEIAPGLVDKLPRQTSRHHSLADPVVRDSYIKMGNRLYRILASQNRGGEIAGFGGDAIVKYGKYIPTTDDETQKPVPVTIKIDHYATAFRRHADGTPWNKEAVIAKDVGFYLDAGRRRKPIKFSQDPKNQRFCELFHWYAVMPDCGKELLVYLFEQHTTVTDAKRHDIAIQACLEVFKLHAGIAAKSKNPIAHRDIKLENFLYDPETNQLTLGDYGYAEYNPYKPATGFFFTPRNFPYIETDYQLSLYTLEQLDIFALKRSIHVPRWTYQRRFNRVETTDPWYSILPLPLLEKLKLKYYFMTGEKDGKYHSALFLTHTLILALYEKTDLITEDENRQKALLVLYASKCLSAKTIDSVYQNNDYCLQLAALISEINHLNSAVLPPEPDMVESSFLSEAKWSAAK